MSLENIRSYVKDELPLVNQIVAEQLGSDISLIQDIGQHIVTGSAKQIRPILVLLGAKVFNYQGQQHLVLAAVIELLHTATLLHDDVVDSASLRRGRKTANKIWGNEASVLVGDYLYSRAFQMMVQVDSMPVMAVLANAVNTVAEGEVMQLLKRNDVDANEQEYMEVIQRKTATFFEAATQLGSILCKRNKAEVQAMSRYGQHVGLAFQLIDDALDYGASQADIGKNIGTDLAEGKPTLPLIYALQHGTSSQVKFLQEMIAKGPTHPDDLLKVCQIIESTQAIKYTYEVARHQVGLAIESLADVPKSPYQQALIEVAQFSVARGY